MTDTTTAAYVSQRIASNLNLVDITPQSKLTLLTQGLLNENNIFTTFKDESIKNMFIQTADESYLEFIGISDGIVRTKEPMVRVTEEDAVVSLNYVSGDRQNEIMPAGSSLELVEGTYWIKLNKPVALGEITDKVYLNGDILAYEEASSISFGEGVSYPITVGETSYDVTFERSVNIPILIESVENFRDRVLYGRQATKTGSESALRLALSSVSLINAYSVNFETNPYEILVFNKSLIDSDSDYDSITQYAIPVLTTKLNQVVSEGTQFTVNVPKKINFSIKLKSNVKDPRPVPGLAYILNEYVKSTYQLGAVYTVNIETLMTYLLRNGEDVDFLADYDFIIYKNFLGNSYESSSTTLKIGVDEYPFLAEVLVE